ncbi:MAG TPA: zinc ABC transporter solute-binding protein [Caldilineae bacterium]|nr:zinc ABC transporter solute-binding protein [Caldilineae bacterium]
MKRKYLLPALTALITTMLLWLAAGCTPTTKTPSNPPATSQASEQLQTDATDLEMLTLPALSAIPLDSRPLRVVATTSIIGDVVTQVGGDTIELTTLMGAGQNPHSYQPAAKDLTVVSQADVIFINGWDLEEALVADLEAIGENAFIVPVSANIEPLPFRNPQKEAGDNHEGGGPDPHVWFSIHNVEQWVKNVEQVLSELDPVHAETYSANAAAYLADLAALDEYAKTRLASIPPEKRVLVTNHGALGYFARDYDFEVLGTVIPGMSTLAEPSASDLANLIATMQEHGVCTIFTETTVSDALAQTVAAELSGCDEVKVLPLYTGAVGPPGSGADSYIGMFHANVDTIARGLK